jgi:hypothetical protein
MPTIMVKINLSKFYDEASWLYLRLMLIHIGFCVELVNCVMCCVTLKRLRPNIVHCHPYYFLVLGKVLAGL